jgi:hypothetical protein
MEEGQTIQLLKEEKTWRDKQRLKKKLMIEQHEPHHKQKR